MSAAQKHQLRNTRNAEFDLGFAGGLIAVSESMFIVSPNPLTERVMITRIPQLFFTQI